MSPLSVERPDNSRERAPQDRLRAVDDSNVVAPYDELILQQIRETVQRVAAAALRGDPSRDVLLTAEDIAQDTMATLHRRGHPALTANLLAWTIGIAKLKLKEATRRAHAQVAQSPLYETDQLVAQDADDQVLGVMHYVWLLDHLTPVDRMIVEWRQAGYSSREMAQELQQIGYPHMTANNVDQRFFRALKTLRTCLFSQETATEGRTYGAGNGGTPDDDRPSY